MLCSLLMIFQLNLTLHCSMQFVKSGVKRYIFTVFLFPFYLMYVIIVFFASVISSTVHVYYILLPLLLSL